MGMRKIKEIIEVYEYCPHSQDCDGDACPYYSRGYPHCYYRLVDDAMSCLKALEPVEAVEMIDDFYPIGDPLRTIGWKCGKCMERIAGYDNYCPNCGQAVKWE